MRLKTILFFSSSRNKFSEHLEGIYAHGRKLNWHVQIIGGKMTRKLIRENLAFWNPAGVFVEYGEQPIFRDLRLFGKIPVVYFDTGKTHPLHGHYITFDSAAVGRLGAEHLLQLDLPTYAYVGYWTPVVWDRERQAAYVQAIRLAGKPCLTFRGMTRLQTSSERARRIQNWLQTLPRPCGVMAANDFVAEEILNVCTRLGIAVPDDLAVLGVDNIRHICESQRPSLSSIAHPILQEGRLAAQVLERLIASPAARPDKPKLWYFPPERLVVRQSTRRIAADRSGVTVALETICRKACAGIGVPEVVEAMGVTRRMAERHFRLATGHSILDEILRVRFEKVYELLANPSCRIDSIAGQSGFSTEVALRKAFRRREGCSMSAWRKRHRA